MNFFHYKDLGKHLLQLCPKVVKHPVLCTGWKQNKKYYIQGLTECGTTSSRINGTTKFSLPFNCGYVVFSTREF